jgi:hypothetical protein
MSTRQDGDWQCDHGAQYFTARDTRFRAEVTRWIQAGAAAMWEPRLAVFVGTMHPVYPARTEKLERLVGTPSMTSPADLPASSLTVRTQSNIVELRRQASRWQFSTAGYGCLQERFDAIVLAVPAPEAAPLVHRAAQVIKREQIAPDDIETVVTNVHQAAIDVLWTVTDPQTVHQAKFSMGTVLAIAAEFGHAGVREFDAHYRESRIAHFSAKVSMVLDAEVDAAYPSRWIGKVTVRTKDGRTYKGRVDDPKGDPGNTLTRAELEHKTITLGLYGKAAIEDELKHSIASVWAITDANVVPQLLPESISEVHHG